MGIPDGLGRLFGDPGSLTTEQVRQWLLVLQPHPDRLMKPSAPSTSGRRGGEHTEPTAMHQSEKRQRHELENIRATLQSGKTPERDYHIAQRPPTAPSGTICSPIIIAAHATSEKIEIFQVERDCGENSSLRLRISSRMGKCVCVLC
jgi:hypothetical protein